MFGTLLSKTKGQAVKEEIGPRVDRLVDSTVLCVRNEGIGDRTT